MTLIFWSQSPELRQDIKTLFSDFSFSNVTIILILFIFITIAATLVLYSNIFEKMINKSFTAEVYLITSILIINIIILNNYHRLGHSYGAEKAAGFVINSNENSFIYLYHEATSSESLNPQLAWYTKGMMNNWIKGKKYKSYPIPLNRNLTDTLDNMRFLKENTVIYYKPKEDEFAKIVYKNVSKEWKITEFCDRYIVFRRKY